MVMTRQRTAPHAPAATPDTPPIDLARVARETPAESIAHENEIVEHLAHEHDYPDQPAEHSVEEQLTALIDPDVIRRH
jgi:hypothetical protein